MLGAWPAVHVERESLEFNANQAEPNSTIGSQK